jgi:putative nucleotidyltransferase with HDIG domain
MAEQQLVLWGLCGRTKGLQWESARALRIGRDSKQDVVLADASVGRRHAELLNDGGHWVIRALADFDRYPTLVNGQRLTTRFGTLQHNDVLQCGRYSFRVELKEAAAAVPPAPAVAGPPDIQTEDALMRVQARTQHTWEATLAAVANHSRADSRQAHSVLAMLRSGRYLQHLTSLDQLLAAALDDAIQTLRAQRGSIVLLDPASAALRVRVLQAPSLPSLGHQGFSKTLAERAFAQGESLLCRDVSGDADLLSAASVLRGAMASVICALLRSPRQCLGVLHLDRGPLQEPFDEADLCQADGIAATIAVAVESAQVVERQREQFLQMAAALAGTVELREQYAVGRSRRVTAYALMLAEEISLPGEARQQLRRGAPLHDIGKIIVEDAILSKPGKLTADEFNLVKLHTVQGASLLESVLELQPIIPIVRHHHERWDGTGYPDGLAQEQISPIARVVSVADAFDAMTSNRPYRPAMPANRALTELVRWSGTHFDPQCVHAFLRARNRAEQILRQG